MERKHQHKQVLLEIKDIFLETIDVKNMNDQAPIFE